MTILAIDPGNERSAFCLVENGVPIRSGKVRNEELIADLRAGVFEPATLAVEMIASYGMAVGREIFDTCLWIGRFIEAWQSHGGKYRLIYRRQVKLHLCESARANDANIRAALIDRFGPGKETAVGRQAPPFWPLAESLEQRVSALADCLQCTASQSVTRARVVFS